MTYPCSGSLLTKLSDAKVRIVSSDPASTSDKAPDLRVIVSCVEIGAAWRRTSKDNCVRGNRRSVSVRRWRHHTNDRRQLTIGPAAASSKPARAWIARPRSAACESKYSSIE
ncbi:DUF736 family protein [Bradyrhizobium tunisiense]|uniref:DUF736 family protein n=1 Tax=Bradyrhizobium tunisiense TaxID=3278709 RepID=UPI0035D6A147